MTLAPPELAATQEDIDGVTKAALDYLHGYTQGDPERHAEAYHAEALKRRYFREDGVIDRLDWVTPQLMVDYTATGRSEVDGVEYDLIIDAITDGMASVRLYSNHWIDFVHIVKARGAWRILNVTWKHHPDNPDYAP